jgi:hypothetical protein
MSTSIFIATWPNGQTTRMNVHGTLDLDRAVRVSFHAYDSRLKGRATRNIKIKSASFVEAPDKVYRDLDVEFYFQKKEQKKDAKQ